MDDLKLFMVLLGSVPKGRNIEQHDVFFGIGNSLKDLVADIQDSWPDGKSLHIDAWREVTEVDGFHIRVLPKEPIAADETRGEQLFFLNLGGYKAGEFDEFHYRLLTIAKEKGEAIRQAKQTAFYKHTGFRGAGSHIDDKFGVDVDDVHQIKEILPAHAKSKYSLEITPAIDKIKDDLHLGYFILSKI